MQPGRMLYTYGLDADALFDAIRGSSDDFPIRSGAHAIKRYGAADDPSAREERVSRVGARGVRARRPQTDEIPADCRVLTALGSARPAGLIPS